MALAGAGTVILLLAKPADQLLVSDHSEPHDHTALAALNPLRFGVALLSMSAALIHFAVIRQHLDEYWLYGAFFIVVAVAQMGWALLVVVQPSPLILVIGAVGNAFVVGTWIITRTVGSLVGPAATETAKAGFGDIVSTAFEVAIVIGAMLLWRSTRFDRPIEPDRGEVVNAAVAISVTLLTVLCLYSAVGGSPFVSHVG